MSSFAESLFNNTTTKNGALAFQSTLSRCLDFFFETLPNTSDHLVVDYLEKSWNESPELTLKLIFQLRDIRKGKADKKNFLVCLEWLNEHHPLTLLENLKFVPEFGCYKDLLDLLGYVTMGSKRSVVYSDHRVKKSRFSRHRGRGYGRRRHTDRIEDADSKRSSGVDIGVQEKKNILRSTLSKARKDYIENSRYRDLNDSIAAIFVSGLLSDEALMEENKPVSGLAAKWCPSLKGSLSRYTVLVDVIAEKLNFSPRSELESDREYTERIHTTYRKLYAKLRKKGRVTEVKMSKKRFDLIHYNQVPSVCMKMNKKTFIKRDGARFEAFLAEVKAGTKTITSGALMPHDIVRSVQNDRGLELETSEAQWKSYVENLKKTGTLSDAIAVCDVSGSMSGRPMEVAMALSLLTAQVSEAPWSNGIITFSGSPTIHHIDPSDSLKQILYKMSRMDWGMNTNIQKVFELLLNVAKRHKIPADKMVKTLFIFSDMEFDVAARPGYCVLEFGGVFWIETGVGDERRSGDAFGVFGPDVEVVLSGGVGEDLAYECVERGG